MGILLGLTAALSWGLADYFAAVASRQTGPFRVVLGFHLVAMVLLTGLMVVSSEGLAGVSRADLAWLA
ncbi:MAG: EamA family transporter, partial [Candidatus Limnocylindria bacterium]